MNDKPDKYAARVFQVSDAVLMLVQSSKQPYIMTNSKIDIFSFQGFRNIPRRPSTRICIRSMPTISLPEKPLRARCRCDICMTPGMRWLRTRVFTPQLSAPPAPTFSTGVWELSMCCLRAYAGVPTDGFVPNLKSTHSVSITSCTRMSAPHAKACRLLLVLAPVSPEKTTDPSGVLNRVNLVVIHQRGPDLDSDLVFGVDQERRGNRAGGTIFCGKLGSDLSHLHQAPEVGIDVVERHVVDGLGERLPDEVGHLAGAGSRRDQGVIGTVGVDELALVESGIVDVQLPAVVRADYLQGAEGTEARPRSDQEEVGVVGDVVVVNVGEEERLHVPEEGRGAGAAIPVALNDRFGVERLA
jgi:hypothetical protein